jgi:hypothetical protein
MADPTPPPRPTWVKALAIAAAVVVALLIVARITDLGGEHGPGRHAVSAAHQRGA